MGGYGGYNFNVKPVEIADQTDFRARKDAAALRKQQLQENQIKLDQAKKQQADQANQEAAAKGAYQPQSYTPPQTQLNVGGYQMNSQPAQVQGPAQFNRGSYVQNLQQTDPLGAMQAQQGFEAQDIEHQKQMAQLSEALGKASGEQLKNLGTALDLQGRYFNAVDQADPKMQPQIYAQARQHAIQAGVPGAQQTPEQFDPQAWQVMKSQFMDVKQAADLANKRIDQQNVVRGQDMTAATAQAGQAVTMRGQNMTDSRSREQNAIAQQNRTQRPPSEGERTAFSFYKRASDAEKVLTDLEPKIAAMGMAGQVGRVMLPNVLQSDDNQVYQQAQRQFTQAKLRRESGAAISQSEYDQDAKTYFPAPGDSKPVLQRKAKARQAIMSELKVASGRAYTETYGDEAGAPIWKEVK